MALTSHVASNVGKEHFPCMTDVKHAYRVFQVTVN